MSVRPAAITLCPDHFVIANSRFDYTSVESIRYYYLVTTIISQGKAYQPEFDLHIRNQLAPIKVRLPANYLSWSLLHTKKRANSLMDLYHNISKRTFEYRAERYLSEMKNNGYFVYDKKRFNSDGNISLDSGKSMFNIRLEARRVFRYPFYLQYKPKGNVLETVARVAYGGNYNINTMFDRDVFFGLLDEYFGLRWND
jgi:hypothetical protein